MANMINIAGTTISVGDLIKITQSVKEDNKEKQLFFEGRVISIRGRESNKTFMVRKIGADNIGVEKIFPAFSPTITKIEVKKSIPVKRAKLYILRHQK